MFDADGVVIESWGFARVLNDEYGISRDNTKEFFAGPFQDCLTGQAELADSLISFLDIWCWPGTTQEFIDLWLKSDDQPNVGVTSKISELKASGAKCYLASNQESIRAAYIREQMRFGELFDQLYFSCDLGFTKPDRRFFDAIAEDISAPSSEIQFWDDSHENVDGAKVAGWDARHFTGVDSLSV